MHDDLLIIPSREDALFGGVKGQTEDVGEVLGDERDGRVGPARESPSHVPHQHPPVIAAWGRGGAEGGEGDCEIFSSRRGEKCTAGRCRTSDQDAEPA